MLEGEFEQYDMEVELTLFRFEEGGRKVGILSNSYGPTIVLNGSVWHAHLILQDRDVLNPGETAHVFVAFFFPHLVKELHVDQTFFLFESGRPIGRGRILRLLNFEKRAEEARQKDENETSRIMRVPSHWEKPLHKYRLRKKKDK